MDSKTPNSNEDYKILMENVPLCVKIFDSQGNLDFINKTGRQEHFIEGLTEEGIKQWDYLSVFDESYQEEVKTKMKLALTGIGNAFEARHVPAHSKNLWCYCIITPIIGDDNKVKYILFISRDITEEKLLELERDKNLEKTEETKLSLFNILEDVKETEGRFQQEIEQSRAIISSIGEGLFVVDSTGKIILTNNKAEEIMETPAARMLDRDYKYLFSAFQGDKELSEDRPAEKVLRKGAPVVVTLEDDYYYRIPSGRKVPVAIVATPLYGEENKVIAAIIVFRDITSEKNLNTAKNSFISVASHQLKTPLTSIRWYAEMLDSGDVGAMANEKQKDFVGKIHNGILELNEVINFLHHAVDAISHQHFFDKRFKMNVRRAQSHSMLNNTIQNSDNRHGLRHLRQIRIFYDRKRFLDILADDFIKLGPDFFLVLFQAVFQTAQCGQMRFNPRVQFRA